MGCSHEALPLLPNLRPTLEITQAPVDTHQPFFYGYELRWAGYDVDGNIDHFRYAVDPPSGVGAETTWVKTLENRKSFLFHADSVSSGTDQTAEGYHTIVLQAVDNRGATSQPVWRSLTAFTIAPIIQIVQPPQVLFFEPTLGPTVRLGWVGYDPDGRGTTKPVKYKFKMFSEDDVDFPFDQVIDRPDSIRRRYGPTRYAEWDSLSADTTAFTFYNLRPGKHIAVVVGFDEAGAYTPELVQYVNMAYFRVSWKDLLGPKMTVYNESFYYEYARGGFSSDPSTYVHTEAAAGRPIHFNWFGTTEKGSYVAGYRWMLDGNVNDETPRGDENAEFHRWSRYSPLTLGVDLPAFEPALSSEVHTLYIEAIDSNQQLSLAGVQFTVVRPIFDKELLIVDDTRLVGDRPIVGGCVDAPRGVWPTAAELDTFFFAKGGKPWRCYPSGTLTPPGIFSGYSYDTLGTRFLPQGLLTLQQLARYRHIVWYTDAKGARNVNQPYLQADPMSELRYLTIAGRSNPLATWISQGGEIWMFGGGTATALQLNTDRAPSDVFSNETGELVPGRFMYDIFGWRSEITVKPTSQASAPSHPMGRSTSPLDYTGLPDYLFEKQFDTDPIAIYAPTRLGNIGNFYQGSHIAEGLTKPNEIIEDLDPSRNGRLEASALDTLYESIGGQLGSEKPIMTVYHGGNAGQIQVFSGFQLWYWRREQQIQILDWVLQKAWKLQRAPVPR